jgi:hypothetical protein
LNHQRKHQTNNMTNRSCFCFLLAISGVFYGRNSQAQMSIGFHAGLLITNVDKTPLDANEPVPENISGFQVAVPFEFAMGKVLALQPEIMIGSHGALQQSNSDVTQLGIRTVSSLKARYQVNTLEIPLLLKLKFGPEALKFHVLAGPSIGFGLSGKFRTQTSIFSTLSNGFVLLDEKSDQTLNAKFVSEGYQANAVAADEFAVTQANLNAHFGAGVSINLGGPYLFLDGRFIQGLSDLRPEASGDTQNDIYKSNRIGLSLGVMFPL